MAEPLDPAKIMAEHETHGWAQTCHGWKKEYTGADLPGEGTADRQSEETEVVDLAKALRDSVAAVVARRKESQESHHG